MIYTLGSRGIAAFSITGVIAAGEKAMDISSIILPGMPFMLRAPAIQWGLCGPRQLNYQE